MTLRHRLVGELMTTAVTTARADTPFKELVRLLSSQDVTALPVLDARDRPLGVVSEADLMRRQASGEDPNGLLPPVRRTAEQWERDTGATAAEVMSSPAVCARPQWTVVEAARLLDDLRIKRLPVVDEAGRLVGIVSRGDLLRVFLRPDRAIIEEIYGDIIRDTLFLNPDALRVTVKDGQVTLDGSVDLSSERHTLLRLCRSVDGVVTVTDHLTHLTDDTALSRGTARAR